MKKTILGLLVWIGIIGAFIAMPSCSRVQRTQTAAKEQGAEKEFAEFCTSSAAAPAFQNLPTRDLLTIDLQRSLFADQKRVAFKAQLSDLYRSERMDALVAYFYVSRGDSEIGAFLKCTDSQLQQLHDDYQKDKNATFMVVAEFDEVSPEALKSATGVKTRLPINEDDYSLSGTLVSYRKSAFPESSPKKSEPESEPSDAD